MSASPEHQIHSPTDVTTWPDFNYSVYVPGII